jgi:hypothetical protein
MTRDLFGFESDPSSASLSRLTKERIKATCKECGKEFIVYRPWQHFCHPDCRMRHFINTRKIKRNEISQKKLAAPKPKIRAKVAT